MTDERFVTTDIEFDRSAPCRFCREDTVEQVIVLSRRGWRPGYRAHAHHSCCKE